jgi:dTDP-4-amino-4,6-dideoxygalactose transaminase
MRASNEDGLWNHFEGRTILLTGGTGSFGSISIRSRSIPRRLGARDSVIHALRAEGVEATLHYPAVHLLSLYREHGGVSGTMPRAERLCERLATLPLYPAMTASDQDDVVLAPRRIHAWAAARAVTS